MLFQVHVTWCSYHMSVGQHQYQGIFVVLPGGDIAARPHSQTLDQ